MTNLRCPKCGESDYLIIEATMKAKINARDRIEEIYFESIDWNDESFVYCAMCYYGGLHKAFVVDDSPT